MIVSRQKYRAPVIRERETTPFDTVEEAWFWFVAAQQAKTEGARIIAGQGMVERPCEPADILKILDRLYRQRALVMPHILVLRYYGRRNMAPDARRIKEARAAKLWREAMDKLEPVLESKGILRKNSWVLRYDPQTRAAPRPYVHPPSFNPYEGVAAE
ncbi:MAG: hypothetical protein KA099_02960 [Alphaproteobacteria bacterium]|nr:hypothetical protein [Alphaproteobacteria bacterium]MBP7759303.1 hypothetical protein [Alphaproteobacteria bacterium]MBP7762516.1 hypothetical protein [Alphaproteobacteria bacterium]MBP7904263.1 hypothetical protein [Alphaproteobacteria bacterium]